MTDLMLRKLRSGVLPALVGKLAARQEDAFTLPAGAPESSLIFLQDLLSSRSFLFDSGASVSVFPALPSTSGSGVRLNV